jgi:hypothetical protein
MKKLLLFFVGFAILSACEENDWDAELEAGPAEQVQSLDDAQYANPPIVLLFAKTGFTYNGSYAYGYVELQNIAYEKNVSVFYRFGGIGAFTEAKASYVAPTHDNLEAWQFATGAVSVGYKQSTSIEFYFKYDVAGKTYYDSNDGQNYKVGVGYDPPLPGYLLKQSAVVLSYADVTTTADDSGAAVAKGLSGLIWVKNLAYTKLVQVVYSTDNWQTVQYANAAYESGSPSGVEGWRFGFNVTGTPKKIEFAIKYTVNGATYWDNNFRNNYSASF